MDMIEELENSIPLNTLFFRSVINNDEIVERIWNVVYPTKKYRKDSKQAKHLKVIIIKLYDCHNSGYDFVRISLNSNDYICGSSKNVLNLSYRVLITIVNNLHNHGYIQHFMGYYSTGTKSGKVSRMRATDKLIELILSVQDSIVEVDKEDVSECYGNLIVLKDFDKKIIDYEDTDLTLEWKEELRKYNSFLSKSSITLNIDTGKKINYDKKHVRRVFNDASFSLGGRFYGGWWQNVKSHFRRHILIDGQESVEIDYSALHLILAYTLIGIDYLNEIGGDPYQIDGIEPCEGLRKLLKTVLLVCINSKNRRSAVMSLNNKLKSGDILKHPKYKMSQLIDICEEKHNAISKYFYSDIGKLLQYNDSMIAYDVIKHFTDKDIIVLCIHDSFICQKEYEDELYEYMIKRIEHVYGTKINLKINSISDKKKEPESSECVREREEEKCVHY